MRSSGATLPFRITILMSLDFDPMDNLEALFESYSPEHSGAAP